MTEVTPGYIAGLPRLFEALAAAPPIDPADLAADAKGEAVTRRRYEGHQCVMCGHPAVAAVMAEKSGLHGDPKWLDLCAKDFHWLGTLMRDPQWDDTRAITEYLRWDVATGHRRRREPPPPGPVRHPSQWARPKPSRIRLHGGPRHAEVLTRRDHEPLPRVLCTVPPPPDWSTITPDMPVPGPLYYRYNGLADMGDTALYVYEGGT